MRWVIGSAVIAAVVGFVVAYAVGGEEMVAPIGPVFAGLLWGGIAIGLVLKLFRKPRPGDRTADRAAFAEWESMYLGRTHAQPTFEERDPGLDHSLVLHEHDLPPVALLEADRASDLLTHEAGELDTGAQQSQPDGARGASEHLRDLCSRSAFPVRHPEKAPIVEG